MSKGLNKADYAEKFAWVIEGFLSKETKIRPCVFLSHKREDKPECKKIAEYFSNAEIDYYLDELDETLQAAAASGNPRLITESIKKGIRESSHMLVVVSAKTFQSPWVPFEIGFGHSAILDKSIEEGIHDDQIKLAVLVLKDLATSTLPDYLKIAYPILGTKSLNEYIVKITGKLEKALVTEELISSYSTMNHPLDNVLNWQL